MSELEKYKAMYLELFDAIASVISTLELARFELKSAPDSEKEKTVDEKIELAIIDLRKSHKKAEEIYMED